MMWLRSILSCVLASAMTPAWTIYKDVCYGHAECLADLYLLNKGVHPVVIFIHGGGWSSGDKSAYAGRAKKYALAGFHVVAINYRLAKFDDPSTQWPAQIEDVTKAFKWVQANAATWRIDPASIMVGGDSAGGHLALMLGCSHDVRPTAILNMFGPCNLAAPGLVELVSALPLFNRQPPDACPNLYASACPLKLITALFPPTILFHGVSDATVPYQQSVELDQQMSRLGVDHKFVTFNGGHELSKLPPVEQLRLEVQGLSWMLAKRG